MTANAIAGWSGIAGNRHAGDCPRTSMTICGAAGQRCLVAPRLIESRLSKPLIAPHLRDYTQICAASPVAPSDRALDVGNPTW